MAAVGEDVMGKPEMFVFDLKNVDSDVKLESQNVRTRVEISATDVEAVGALIGPKVEATDAEEQCVFSR